MSILKSVESVSCKVSVKLPLMLEVTSENCFSIVLTARSKATCHPDRGGNPGFKKGWIWCVTIFINCLCLSVKQLAK